MCPCPCLSLLFGIKFITGFGCHQTKEISHCLFSSVSFLVVANICPEDVKHSRAAGVGIVVLFFCRCALLQTWMALVFPNPLFELELPHRSKGGCWWPPTTSKINPNSTSAFVSLHMFRVFLVAARILYWHVNGSFMTGR